MALLTVVGWFGWKNWQRKWAGEASMLYEQVQKVVDGKDTEKVKRTATDMGDRFGSMAYTQMIVLVAAKVLYEADDTVSTKAQLQWTVDHAHDDEHKALAKLCLASLLLDERAHDQDVMLVSGDVAPAFVGPYADRRGDLLIAQNKNENVRAAYKLALKEFGPADVSVCQIVQLKLGVLGGA